MISLGTIDGLTIYATYYLRGLTLDTHETCKRILWQILKIMLKCSGHARIPDFSSGWGIHAQLAGKKALKMLIFFFLVLNFNRGAPMVI